MHSPTALPAAELDAAVAFLVDRQDADGLWRDYVLPPGASDAWTTSYVGLVLSRCAAAAPAVERARLAVAALRRPDGWGYNAATASDADTTSFALRFVGGPAALLERFLDGDCGAHTFAGDQFGSWSWAHADVTATVGLALADPRRARPAVLAARMPGGVWQSFWWTTPAYATARSLELLAATGGLPVEVASDAHAWLNALCAPATGFEAALRLEIADRLDEQPDAHRARLLALQRADGGWDPSPALLTPAQADGTPGLPHADVNRLLTTATAAAALIEEGQPSRAALGCGVSPS